MLDMLFIIWFGIMPADPCPEMSRQDSIRTMLYNSCWPYHDSIVDSIDCNVPDLNELKL